MIIFKRHFAKIAGKPQAINTLNVWETSQGDLGAFAAKEITLVNLDYLLSLQQGLALSFNSRCEWLCTLRIQRITYQSGQKSQSD